MISTHGGGGPAPGPRSLESNTNDSQSLLDDVSPDLFRSVPANRVLALGADVFWDQDATGSYGALPPDDAADAIYGTSEPCSQCDAFVSHAWRDDARLKYLALCHRTFLGHAVVLSGMAWLCLVVGLLAASKWDITAYGGETLRLTAAFLGVSSTAFLSVYLFGHALGLGRETTWWLDKLCVHQRDDGLKQAGLRALPTFLARSDRLIVLASEHYFKRLWCNYEVATFLGDHPIDRVDIVPLWLAPWLLATLAVDCVCSLLVVLVVSRNMYLFVDVLGTTAGVLARLTVTFCVGYSPAVPFILFGLREQTRLRDRMLEQLRNFSFDNTECLEPSDRAIVEARIVKAHGSLGAFETLVRTDLAALLGQRVGADSSFTAFQLTMFPGLAFCWASAADVLGCEDRPCGESARIYGLSSGRAYVIINAILWLQYIITARSIYPCIVWALAFTERRRRPWVRAAGGACVIAAAFAAWGFLGSLGAILVFEAHAGAGASTVLLAASFGSLAAWNLHVLRRPAATTPRRRDISN